MRYRVGSTKIIKETGALDTMKGFLRTWFVIDSGVNHPAVARRCSKTESRLRFQQEEIVLITRKLGGNRQPNHAAPDNDYVDRLITHDFSDAAR